jgi:transcription-repair coupling factor (superfamily II helicase)
MYLKLLDEAIKEERNIEVKEDFETYIDINLDAFIPRGYIESETNRLAVYKKIALISCDDDYFDVQDEITDRYGEIPKEIQNLLEVAILKAAAHSIGIISVIEKNKNIVLTFRHDANIDPGAIARFVNKYKTLCYFTAAPNPYITIKLNSLKTADKTREAGYIKNMLQELKDLNFSLS